MSAWVKQLASQVKKHGKAKASWYAIWKEPDGSQRTKSFGPGKDGKRLAQLFAERVKAQLKLGTYEADKPNRTTWKEFAERYDKQHLSTLKGRTAALYSLKPFAELLKLDDKPLSYITAERIDRFITLRRQQRGVKPGSKVSAGTINKDLRHIRAALTKAKKWGYVKDVPEITMIREPKRRKNYVAEDHFTDIYNACDAAKQPADLPSSAGQWWRGLLTFAYLTGWRIGELLSLVWDDVSLDHGFAVTRAKDNKGGRDESVYLHPIVVEHIRPLWTPDDPRVFPWDWTRRPLYTEFARIQKAAGINLPCIEQREHDCTPACHLYAFHDERRAFATHNAERLPMKQLQAMMRHVSSQTTEGYIQYAQSARPAAVDIHVPAGLVGMGCARDIPHDPDLP